MKQVLFLLVLISLIAFSCKKLKKLENDITTEKFIPSLTLNPVDSAVQLYTPSCGEFIPFPFDSVQSIEIDIDKNGENDYSFTYTTAYNFISTSDSCKNHNSKVEVKALGIGNNIFVENKVNKKAKVFEEGEEIDNSNHLSSNAIIFQDDGLSSEEISMENGNKYIGVKLFSGSVGWIKVYHRRDSFDFSIMEHALNKTVQLTIKAGHRD
ncbi:hypothetical protein [Brumimicrobium mesophilum]|uniref:hypothetical protein n=1 Tax=Brumimicrobium mesophilum TaxID=392717 RepID=UPI000D140B92|nr:hypothetical protein [Brumimicrobium mesophilum]